MYAGVILAFFGSLSVVIGLPLNGIIIKYLIRKPQGEKTGFHLVLIESSIIQAVRSTLGYATLMFGLIWVNILQLVVDL